MREFFGFGGYRRPAEGFLSWQHLTFVTILVLIATVLAVVLGRRNRTKDDKTKNRVLIVAALAMDGLEVFKLIIECAREGSAHPLLLNLPLFLCSIQLITLPLAAFSKGRFREAALDFVLIFGPLGALMGTYGAGNNYGTYPVLCFDNVISGLTHCIAGFAAVYIAIVGYASMKRRNIWITCCIMLGFCGVAYIADVLIPYNYMFLMNHDGTPYSIFYNLLNGNRVLYPLSVVVLFLLYIAAFYGVFYLIRHLRDRKKASAKSSDQA